MLTRVQSFLTAYHKGLSTRVRNIVSKNPRTHEKFRKATCLKNVWFVCIQNFGSTFDPRAVWFPVTNNSLSKTLMRTSRHQFGQIVQLVTGHNFLRYHQNLINNDINPLCRMCCEADETSYHIVCKCPAFWKLKADVFKTYETINNLEWSVRQVLKLVSNPQLSSLLEGENEPSNIQQTRQKTNSRRCMRVQ